LYLLSFIYTSESVLALTASRDMDVSFRNIHMKDAQYILVSGQTPVGTITIRCGGTDIMDVIIQVDGAWQVTQSAVWVGPVGQYPAVPVDPPTFPYVQFTAFPGGHFSVFKDIQVDPSWISNVGTINVVVNVVLSQIVLSQATLEQISSSPTGAGPCGTNYVRNIYSEKHTTSYYLTDLDGFFFDSWVVDSTAPAIIEQQYTANLISSYSSVFSTPEGLNYVDKPGNLPIANYIVNNARTYLSADNLTCDVRSIQNALSYFLDNNPTYLPVQSQACYNFIVNDAQTNGANFVPPCPGGRYIIIAVPIDPTTCKPMNAQVTAIVVSGLCWIGQCQIVTSGAEGWGIAAEADGSQSVPGDTTGATFFTIPFNCP